MYEEIPPASDASDPSEGLGPVPPKPEPTATTSAVPLGGGSGPKWPSQSTSTVAAPVVTPTPTSHSAKPLVIGLSVVAAGLAGLSGYGFMQGKEHKQSLDNANATAAAVEQTNKALDSDLKKARKDMADAQEAHKDTISKKDEELREAMAKANDASNELAKQEEKTKELLEKVEAANSMVEEKERLVNELAELKKANEELDGQKAKAEQEAQRLTQELSNRKPVTSVSISTPTQDTPAPRKTSVLKEDKPEVPEAISRGTALAWERLGKYETGKNKGRWYYVAPDGFISPLYASRELAVYQAELRAGSRQSDYGTSGQMGVGADSAK